MYRCYDDVPEFRGELRKKMVLVPSVVEQASGIRIFGKLLKCLVFSTDIAIIRNCNAHGVIAVYPFTPQPTISQAIINASDIPVFAGIGGGTTAGKRVINLGIDAENQGAIGVVLNAPTANELIKELDGRLDIPIVVTVVSKNTDIEARLAAGVDILNVSVAADTPAVVRHIRERFPQVPIIATGGPNEKTMLETIRAGANCITFTPPTNAEIFAGMMEEYRDREK